MKVYITEYINEMDNVISKGKITNKIIDDHLTKISFFQHERLIHLMVTLFYAFLFIVFLALICVSYFFIPLAVIITIFLLFYIPYYFYLENCVQYLYKQYDKLKESDN